MSYNNPMKAFLILVISSVLSILLSTTANAGKKTITLYHTDALGSIVAASDVEGNVIWRKTYDPYGNEVITTENGKEYEGQAYTGKPYDKETGLLYLGQRYYDPEIKRFLSMDPVGFVASNPASFNRYAYANNNPYKFIDPDGRSALTAFGGVLHESYNFTQGRGFNGPMIMGALVDGYNGEGKGFGWSLFEDVTSFVPLGSAVKGYRLIKGRFGNTPTQLAATNLAAKGIPDSALVVRGGNEANQAAAKINSAIGPSRTPGVEGFSAQCNGGTCLSTLGGVLKNKQVGVTTAGDIRKAGGDVITTPGFGNHVTVTNLSGEAASPLLKVVKNPNPAK